jgi:hypothetical protein
MKPRVHLGSIRFFVDPVVCPLPVGESYEDQSGIKFAAEFWKMALIERIARIISWDGRAIPDKDSQKFLLGGSNDWWLRQGEEPNEFVVSYRYGLGPEMATKMSNLRDVIIWLLGLEKFNCEGQAAELQQDVGFIGGFCFDPRQSLEKDYLSRLAGILGWTGKFAVAREKLGWHIPKGILAYPDVNSNWCIPAGTKANEVVIAGFGGDQKLMDKLISTIVWLLDLERFNDD